jgi:hypothetical protein
VEGKMNTSKFKPNLYLVVLLVVVMLTTVSGVWASQENVDICHLDDEGNYIPISIANPAVDAHLRHGDSVVGDGFDANCEPLSHCPTPELGVSTARYAFGAEGWPDDVATIYIFLTTGITEEPPPDCFISELGQNYLDSRMDFSIPGGDVVVSLPTDFVWEPGVIVIRPDVFTGEPYAFGDIFQGVETDPDLSPILLANPVLDVYAKLCNKDGACDDLDFILTEGPGR